MKVIQYYSIVSLGLTKAAREARGQTAAGADYLAELTANDTTYLRGQLDREAQRTGQMLADARRDLGAFKEATREEVEKIFSLRKCILRC